MFLGQTFDVAFASLMPHLWNDLSFGLAELRRLAKWQIILFFEPAINGWFWLLDFFPKR